MKLVPQLLYGHPKVRKIMIDGLSCIVHKTLDTIDTNTDHYVTSHVFSIVLKGSLNIETYYESERYVASQNQIVFIPKGRYMISDILPEDGEFEALFFFFEEELINQFLASVKSQPWLQKPQSLIFDYTESIKHFTKAILSVYSTNITRTKNLTKLKLLELLYLIYDSNQQEQLVQLLLNLSTKKKRNLPEFMASNFDKPLGVEDYAYLTGRSLSSFNRDFKRIFNTAPKKWLIDKRLEKAEQLLLNSSLYIQEIATEVGFASVSHFVSVFGKHYGISPKQFLLKNNLEKVS